MAFLQRFRAYGAALSLFAPNSQLRTTISQPPLLPPEPEQAGIAADEQIRQNDFHGRVSNLRWNVQRISQIT
jgi:hypothetical protein